MKITGGNFKGRKILAPDEKITRPTLSKTRESVFNILFLVLLKSSESGYLVSIGLSYCCSAIYLIFRGGVHKSYKKRIDSKSDLNILYKYCVPLIFYNVLYFYQSVLLQKIQALGGFILRPVYKKGKIIDIE